MAPVSSCGPVLALTGGMKSQRGFSLLEIMVTVSITAIVGGMATAQMGPTRRSLQGDGAMRLVMTQLNTAREMAITQRLNMELQFVGGNWVRIIRHEAPGIATTVLSSVALESGETFSLAAGVPDTPEAYGNLNAVGFGAAQVIMFTTDGTLIDENGNPLNGTVFLSIPNSPQSVRAVAVLGATGRVRGYKWTVDANGQGVGWVRI